MLFLRQAVILVELIFQDKTLINTSVSSSLMAFALFSFTPGSQSANGSPIRRHLGSLLLRPTLSDSQCYPVITCMSKHILPLPAFRAVFDYPQQARVGVAPVGSAYLYSATVPSDHKSTYSSKLLNPEVEHRFRSSPSNCNHIITCTNGEDA
jgi:hypothetical protein